MRLSTGVVACVMIGVLVWLVYTAAVSQTLYAQVMGAIDAARTIEMVGASLRDGKWIKDMDVRYERGLGVVEYTYRNGRTFSRLDNGMYVWTKRGRSCRPVRSNGSDPLGAVRKVFRGAARLLQDPEDFTRKRDGDKRLDGVWCKLYVLADSRSARAQKPADAGQQQKAPDIRILSWIDRRGRMRRWYEQRRRDGAWQTYRIVHIKYGVPVSRCLFTPRGAFCLSPTVEIDDSVCPHKADSSGPRASGDQTAGASTVKFRSGSSSRFSSGSTAGSLRPSPA
jgi:hypothetical protein